MKKIIYFITALLIFIICYIGDCSYAQTLSASDWIDKVIEENSLEKIIEYCNKAIEIDSKYSPAYLARGMAYKNLGQYQKAIEEYNMVLKINPKSKAAYNNRGNAYKELGQYQKAIEDYTKALEIDPKYTNAYNNRLIAYEKLTETQKTSIGQNSIISTDKSQVPTEKSATSTQTIPVPTFDSYKWEVGLPGFTKPGDITYFEDASSDTVRLLSPTNGATLSSGNITFSWNPVSYATKYHFILYNSQGQITLDMPTSSTSITLSLGIPETVTWKVRAGDNSGNWGAWSGIWSLNVKSTNRNFKITDYQAKWKILENGDIQVSEIFTYDFDGIFNGIIRSIGTGGSDGLVYFQASEYSPQKKILETTQNMDGDMVTFKIYDQSNNEKKSFLLEYKLKNVITKYSDIAEFYWKFFDQTNTSPIGNIKVEVEYFKEISKEKLNASVFGPLDGNISIQEKGKVVYEVGRLSPGEILGVRILYPIGTYSQLDETTHPLQGSLHCPDKAGYTCPSCLEAPGYVNHFKSFNILTTQEDCYVRLVTKDNSSIGNHNDCEVIIKGEKWLGLEDESGRVLAEEINKGNFEFIPANLFAERTMTFPQDHYQYEFADGGKEFRLYLSRTITEAFQAVPWQNLSVEIKNQKTNKVFTYQFEKGIFPRPYTWSNGVANYGQCVWWAANRWVEEVDSQSLFPFYPPSSDMKGVKPIDSNYQPEQYDVLIDYIPGGPPRHYAFVEKVEDDLVYITQFNFIPPGEVYNHVPRFWSGNPKSLYYSLNPHNEYYFKYYYRK